VLSSVRYDSLSFLLFCPKGKTTLGILVRDEAARFKLREQVGDIGLIMYVPLSLCIKLLLTTSRTLYESKGLEFNDVRIRHSYIIEGKI
jgi:hypothetical protein